MTVPVGERPDAPRTPVADPSAGVPLNRREAPAFHRPDITEVCPYLAAASGGWRSAFPHREHRCGAVDPPAPLSTEKQRRLCLAAEHASCATFRAARASRAAMLAPGVDPAAVAAADAARRPVARSSALILEHPRLSAPRARWPVDRAMSQVALVGLMVVAFLAVAFARFSGPEAAAVATSPSPVAARTASPTPRSTPRPTITAAPAVVPSPSAAVAASATPSGAVEAATATPGSTKTYVVKNGDTLYGIASVYGTTVQVIKNLNGLTSNSLKVGQKLKIP